ncbi:hypothetical protein SCP_0605010 [Sparassis crispa]|uniref:GTP-binding protein 2 n=1 Tax=Sparassis crispa TaxID=139825 RepID=A0A401GQN5_9APHY|nr:hypothetical protein SCP_0605010 [Sparassis crispa]GBE84522.1 hypothetical protein SCP_0605010 [Sparassis crispa]
MFGEPVSDSLRARSPWDPFLPTPPTDSPPEAIKCLRNGIPKLVPEVEEGNIEYKLKLTNISAARFARLVTQLKWRLLEGGGQAYYELGVADSGALIGLSRADLEESLETLEMMAGEIGASVIVVKEIEVPPIMVALADESTGYLDPATGDWTGKMRKKVAVLTDEGTTEADTELSTTDVTDSDEPPSLSNPSTPADPAYAAPVPCYTSIYSQCRSVSNPDRPTAQSSPSIAPIDDDLALFSMEPEPAFSVDADDDVSDSDVGPSPFLVDLEIASVYKPRPVRVRTHTSVVSVSSPLHASAYSSHGKRHKFKEKEKKHQPWRSQPPQSDGALCGNVVREEIPNTPESKAAKRRLMRDRRREERKVLVGESEVDNEFMQVVAIKETVSVALQSEVLEDGDLTIAATEAVISVAAIGKEDDKDTAELVSGLDALHVAVQTSTAIVDHVAKAGDGEEVPEEKELEPRLIVEALVVRKSSIEEAFLDFGGFSLVANTL